MKERVGVGMKENNADLVQTLFLCSLLSCTYSKATGGAVDRAWRWFFRFMCFQDVKMLLLERLLYLSYNLLRCSQ